VPTSTGVSSEREQRMDLEYSRHRTRNPGPRSTMESFAGVETRFGLGYWSYRPVRLSSCPRAGAQPVHRMCRDWMVSNRKGFF